MNCFIRFTALAFVLLHLAGCASSSVVKLANPVITGKPVSMDNIYVTTSSPLGDVVVEQHTLCDAIISGLNETKMFPSVTASKPADSSNGVIVNAEIRAIKKVSDRAREWSGALAGRARVLIRVTISDLNSGSQIEVFEADGESGKAAFAGTTDEAIQRAAEQVVPKMLKLNADLADDKAAKLY